MADGAVATDTLIGYVGQDTTYVFCVGTRIKSSSIANPSVITTCDTNGTPAPHGLRAGQTIYIVRHYGSTPAIDGTYIVLSVPDANSFAIAVNCTIAGAEGFVTSLTNDITGKTYVMTIKDADVAATFTKTVNGVVSDGPHREFNVPVPAATAATIPVSASHKYDVWQTNAGSAWVFADGTYTQRSERRVTPP